MQYRHFKQLLKKYNVKYYCILSFKGPFVKNNNKKVIVFMRI